ncbi:GyrI-like domain-containing protein [Myxococcus sp. AM010]|uniref:GyrI-like domain-containing protein n=1 Tax=Myxococcus sp. AM010 TaxID=2745138 RepID=UPI001595095D|nr:GyrI-like domain-containing protein [Myxococcus sp. AM010]NVJ17516.1 GyrI-like domain-containing protein [Myxococcus sp. AM010]
MNVSIVSRGEIKLVGIKVVGRRSELSHRVPLAWLELLSRVDGLPGVVDRDLFHGCVPGSDHEQPGADPVYRYWVTTEVRDLDAVTDGLQTLMIPARDYAMTPVQGTADAINAAYSRLAAWLQAQGRRSEPAAYVLERYDQRRQPVTPPYERFDYELLTPLAS